MDPDDYKWRCSVFASLFLAGCALVSLGGLLGGTLGAGVALCSFVFVVAVLALVRLTMLPPPF